MALQPVCRLVYDSMTVAQLKKVLKEKGILISGKKADLIARLKWDNLRILGQIGDKRAVEPLIKALKDDRGHAVRRIAAYALGEIGDKRAVEPLIEMLEDEDQAVHRAAEIALKNIGKPAVEPLIEMLSGEDSDVRKSATEVLGWIGDARAVEPLVKMLSNEYSDSPTAHALGNIGDKRAVEPLIKALKDDRGHVRWAAASALGNIGDARAVEPLTMALEGGNSGAKEALEKLGHEVE